MSEAITSSLEPTEVDRTTLILTCIQAIYGIPSYLLLIFFVFYLGCRPNYHYSFYRLVQLDLFINILLYTNTWIGFRTESFPSFTPLLKSIESLVPGSLTFSKALPNWFFHMQWCTAAALNLHRFTSVAFPTNNETMWKRFYLPFGAICAIYSFLPILFQEGRTPEVSIIDGVLKKITHPARYFKIMKLTGIFSVVYFVFLLILGLGTAVLLRRKFHSVNVSDRGVAKKLTWIALVYGFIYTGILMWSVLGALDVYLSFFPSFVKKINSILMIFASDMMTLALPYILIIFDTNVRSDFCIQEKRRTIANAVVVT